MVGCGRAMTHSSRPISVARREAHPARLGTIAFNVRQFRVVAVFRSAWQFSRNVVDFPQSSRITFGQAWGFMILFLARRLRFR